jgi:hypothetical protein
MSNAARSTLSIKAREDPVAIGSVDDRTFETEKKEDDWTAHLSNQPHHFFFWLRRKKTNMPQFFTTTKSFINFYSSPNVDLSHLFSKSGVIGALHPIFMFIFDSI